jgi:hypothetical protein
MNKNGEAIVEGTVTKEGALWSPATIVKSDTGFMLNLATTMVTAENVEEPLCGATRPNNY